MKAEKMAEDLAKRQRHAQILRDIAALEPGEEEGNLHFYAVNMLAQLRQEFADYDPTYPSAITLAQKRTAASIDHINTMAPPRAPRPSRPPRLSRTPSINRGQLQQAETPLLQMEVAPSLPMAPPPPPQPSVVLPQKEGVFTRLLEKLKFFFVRFRRIALGDEC